MDMSKHRGRVPNPMGIKCERCGSEHVIRFGIYVGRRGKRLQRVKCQECGHVYVPKEWK